MGNLQKEEWSKNGVIVTVYEELSSSTIGSQFHDQKKIRTTNPNTKKRSCGYDRHAELLAYAHQLRQQANSQQIHHHHHNSTESNLRKPKKRRLLGGLKGLKLSIGRIFEGEKKRATKYERVESCPSPPHPPGKWKGSWSKISKTLCCVLKQCSSVSKCCKGFDHEESDLYNRNQR
ncbi:unnamed protein product [Amaranthus hypochondriacus]